MKVYYNEKDKFAAEWLRQLIMFGAIPAGDVDERSIKEVEGYELANYDQCHFFAGIGGWADALELANWQGPVWTGSCPCQPFSVAGAGLGEADERHLWPEFKRLIADCRPPVVFGEQVASRLGREWLARVRLDLEALGYGVGAADLCAAGESAPHIRQRLYWVGQSERDPGRARWSSARPSSSSTQAPGTGAPVEPGRRGMLGGVGIPDAMRAERGSPAEGRHEHDRCDAGWQEAPGGLVPCSETSGGGILHTTGARCHSARTGAEEEAWNETRLRGPEPGCAVGGMGVGTSVGRPRCGDEPEHGEPVQANPWSSAEFVPCLDNKARRVEPGIFPLADGFPNRVGTLRGAGNAIVPQVAETFIRAFRGA